MRRAFARLFLLGALMFVLTVPASGEAEVASSLEISPQALAFVGVRVGTTSQAGTLTVTMRDGSLPLTIADLWTGDAEHFQVVSDGCTGQLLHVGESCALQLVFSPDLAGHVATSLILRSQGEEVLAVIPLEGFGIAPRLWLSVTDIDFGDQTVGRSSIPSEIQMKNVGSDELAITGIEVDDGFILTEDCGNQLSVGESCMLEASFAPIAEGAMQGVISITNDAPNGAQGINVSGMGVLAGKPDASLSAIQLDFGEQPVGEMSDAKSILLANTGTVGLELFSFESSSGFLATDDCGATIAPNGTCAVEVTFLPEARGAYEGTLLIDGDASDYPKQIWLRGVGVQKGDPTAVFTPLSLDFGEQALNKASDPLTITLTNEGDGDLVIEDVSIGVDSTGSFSFTDTCHGATLVPSESCQMTVTFKPTEKGTLGATIVVTHNASGSPTTLLLTGVGIRTSGGGCSLLAR